MKCYIKLLLVAALAVTIVPNSFGNDWLPPDVVELFGATTLQPDTLGTKQNPKNRSAANPTDIKKLEKQRISLIVENPPLNDWVPLDILRMFEAPALQPKWYAGTD